MGPRGRFYSYMYHVSDVGTNIVLRIELPVQRRLCSIFVRNVGSPDIHECFCGLTGSQQTPRFWGVTMTIIRERQRERQREEKFFLRETGIECKTREDSNFLKKCKMVISVKIQNFSRSRMTKRTSPLESSCEI